jgi:hypothetical protein
VAARNGQTGAPDRCRYPVHRPRRQNKRNRNGFAIGGQHKKAGLTGALFELISLEPFGKGLKGRSRLVIHKDRNG